MMSSQKNSPAVASAKTAVPQDDFAPPSFLLYNHSGKFEAFGAKGLVPHGVISTLTERAAAFFSQQQSDPSNPNYIVGALPFEPTESDYLFQPESVYQSHSADESFDSVPELSDPPSCSPIRALEIQQKPTADHYCDVVHQVVQRLKSQVEPDLEKVVLARRLQLETDQPVNPHLLVSRLNVDPQVTTFLTPLSGGLGVPRSWMVGATPELLVSRQGMSVVSHPLAGSAPRSADKRDDERAAQQLLESSKDNHEHRLVVEAICDVLTPFCRELSVPKRPHLKSTKTVWHLGTRIEGTLRDPQTPVTSLVAQLHPTPAVCGTPTSAALQIIRDMESFERGFYSGAIGWADENGNGEWYVTIRCALIQDRALHLFAGAGIVEGSVPELERQETTAKFRALLNALGIAETNAN